MVFTLDNMANEQSALKELSQLRAAFNQLQQVNSDLEIALSTAVEHGDAIEEQLSREIEVRGQAEARLLKMVETITRQKQDLEIALSTAIEHGDAIEEQMLDLLNQLKHEIGERRQAESELHALVEAVNKQKEDLEMIVETIASHGDEINAQISDQLKEASYQARTDALTGINNRQAFDETLDAEWFRALREQTPLGIIICDVDHFKQYNDTLGHSAGDICLKSVAAALSKLGRRAGDLIARYGGEEFIILLPDSGQEDVVEMAQRAVTAIAELAIPHPKSQHGVITISAGGISMLPGKGADPGRCVEEADRNLYTAKRQGRNQAIVATYISKLTSDHHGYPAGKDR